jgi:hypothetical protein
LPSFIPVSWPVETADQSFFAPAHPPPFSLGINKKHFHSRRDFVLW